MIKYQFWLLYLLTACSLLGCLGEVDTLSSESAGVALDTPSSSNGGGNDGSDSSDDDSNGGFAATPGVDPSPAAEDLSSPGPDSGGASASAAGQGDGDGLGGAGGAAQETPQNLCSVNRGGCDPLSLCSYDGVDVTCGACPPGYVDIDDTANTRCQDVDECTNANGGCDHGCANHEVPGRFAVCSCEPGYRLADDDVTCNDFDECSVDNGGCGGFCTDHVEPGEPPLCSCPDGAVLDTDGTTCLDVDECETDNGGCDLKTSCTNAGIVGRFPICGPCPFGFTGNGYAGCQDINECDINNGGCGSGVDCLNFSGGHLCGDCPLGRAGAAPNCVDIDECLTGHGSCDLLTTCSNAPLSGDPPLCGDCPIGYEGRRLARRRQRLALHRAVAVRPAPRAMARLSAVTSTNARLPTAVVTR
jgi:hypothetical protein